MGVPQPFPSPGLSVRLLARCLQAEPDVPRPPPATHRPRVAPCSSQPEALPHSREHGLPLGAPGPGQGPRGKVPGPPAARPSPRTHLNAFRQASGMCSLSNLFKESRKVSTLPIMIFAAFQLLSLGILPPGAVRIMTAAVTLTTASGGDPKDFSSVRLFCKRQAGGA